MTRGSFVLFKKIKLDSPRQYLSFTLTYTIFKVVVGRIGLDSKKGISQDGTCVGEEYSRTVFEAIIFWRFTVRLIFLCYGIRFVVTTEIAAYPPVPTYHRVSSI